MPYHTLKVADIMTPKVVTVDANETLETAREILRRYRIHHLLITEDGKPVGVVSDRDVMRHLSPFVGAGADERYQDAATLKTRMHELMSRKLISIGPDDLALDAAGLMLRHQISCLPVIDESDRLVGILTTRDLVRSMAQVQLAFLQGVAAR